MKLIAVSLLDKKAGHYSPPDFVRSTVDAIRSWDKMVNTPETKYNSHPEDFCILEIGEYDDEIGVFTQHEHSKPIASGIDVIKSQQ